MTDKALDVCQCHEKRAPAYWEGVVREYKDALEKAEKERDEALAGVRVLARENIECHERAAASCGHPNHGSRDHDCGPFTPAAESRPLTPDAITDEMVERAAHCMAMQQMPSTYSLEPDDTAGKFYDDACDVLHAALTEPPARPKGAERWEDWLIEALPHESMPDEDIALLADRIAARVAEEAGA